MVRGISKNWWAVGLRGVAAILFGLTAIAWPGLTLEVLVLWFGFYAIVGGIFSLLAAGSPTRWGNKDRLILIFEALFAILIGLATVVWPAITAVALLLLIASYAFVSGILQVAAALRPATGQPAGNDWLMGLSGALSIGFGLLLVVWPDSGLLSLVWLIGLYALLFGTMLLGMAYQLYRSYRESRRPLSHRVII